MQDQVTGVPAARNGCEKVPAELELGRCARLAERDLSMNRNQLIQQTTVESQALEHVTRALEVILGWTSEGHDISRKLSSVRFYTELYQRHLERLFALEEVEGYMETISSLKPELANQVDDLKREHEEFRAAVRWSVVRIDLASPTQLVQFDATCDKLRVTINQVLEHIRRENELLVESMQQDTGGEG
jgi:hemerythrin-like domain-containing protein